MTDHRKRSCQWLWKLHPWSIRDKFEWERCLVGLQTPAQDRLSKAGYSRLCPFRCRKQAKMFHVLFGLPSNIWFSSFINYLNKAHETSVSNPTFTQGLDQVTPEVSSNQFKFLYQIPGKFVPSVHFSACKSQHLDSTFVPLKLIQTNTSPAFLHLLRN